MENTENINPIPETFTTIELDSTDKVNQRYTMLCNMKNENGDFLNVSEPLNTTISYSFRLFDKVGNTLLLVIFYR